MIPRVNEAIYAIRKTSFQLNHNNEDIYNLLKSKIDKYKVVICYGPAGSGKTILAMKLLQENPLRSRLLLLNKKFYYANQLDYDYPSEGIIYGSDAFLLSINEHSISIIDEAQRINYDTLLKIIKRSKTTFIFGDENQIFEKRYITFNSDELYKKLICEEALSVKKVEVKCCKRYSNEASSALNFLTKPGNEKPERAKLLNDYQINIFCDETKFLEKYDSVEGLKKMYTPFTCLSSYTFFIEIGGKRFSRYPTDCNNFSLIEDENLIYFFGTTYDAISFDVDHCFVYLTRVHIINEKTDKDSECIYYKNEFDSEENLKIFLNDLHILFTRGKKSLNIYVDDAQVYLYLKNKISLLRK